MRNVDLKDIALFLAPSVLLLGFLYAVNTFFPMRTVPAFVSDGISVYVDSATGCEYICVIDVGGPITPRLGPDGKPICGLR